MPELTYMYAACNSAQCADVQRRKETELLRFFLRELKKKKKREILSLCVKVNTSEYCKTKYRGDYVLLQSEFGFS